MTRKDSGPVLEADITAADLRAMYVTIGDKVVYIDYTLDELIVTSWTNND